MNNMTNNTEESENLHKADQVYFLYDPQPVRLLDVIYVGPVMIYGGIKGKFHPFVKWSLIGVGICTILYNGANFYINEKRAMEKRKAETDAIKRALEQAQAQVDEQMTNAVGGQAPKVTPVTQTPVTETYLTNDDKEEDKIQLPREVAELLNHPFLPTDNKNVIAKKGRPKAKAIDAEVIFEKQYIENGKDSKIN
jgi:hypothetical protein